MKDHLIKEKTQIGRDFRVCGYCGCTRNTIKSRYPKMVAANKSLWYRSETGWKCRNCHNAESKRDSRKLLKETNPVLYMMKVRKETNQHNEKKKEHYFQYEGHKRIIIEATKHKLNMRREAFAKNFDKTHLKKKEALEQRYIELFIAWKESGFEKDLTPILTKPTYNRPYSASNARWTTWVGIGKTESAEKKASGAIGEIQDSIKSYAERHEKAYAKDQEVCPFTQEELEEIRKTIEKGRRQHVR